MLSIPITLRNIYFLSHFRIFIKVFFVIQILVESNHFQWGLYNILRSLVITRDMHLMISF